MTLTKQTFIDKKLGELSKEITDTVIIDSTLYQTIVDYKEFLNKKSEIIKESKNDSLPKPISGGKLLRDDVVIKLHKEFNNTGIFWIGDIDLADFLKCFNLGVAPSGVLAIKNQKRMAFILREIDGINEEIAAERFKVNNYSSVKSSLDTRTKVDEKIIKEKIKNIIRGK